MNIFHPKLLCTFNYFLRINRSKHKAEWSNQRKWLSLCILVASLFSKKGFTHIYSFFFFLTHLYSYRRHPWWVSGKESACQCMRHRFLPGSGGSPGEGNSNPLQYSCLGNLMDRGACRVTVHGLPKELDITYQLNNYSYQQCFKVFIFSIFWLSKIICFFIFSKFISRGKKKKIGKTRKV